MKLAKRLNWGRRNDGNSDFSFVTNLARMTRSNPYGDVPVLINPPIAPDNGFPPSLQPTEAYESLRYLVPGRPIREANPQDYSERFFNRPDAVRDFLRKISPNAARERSGKTRTVLTSR